MHLPELRADPAATGITAGVVVKKLLGYIM
jgi:hypothetical protein